MAGNNGTAVGTIAYDTTAPILGSASLQAGTNSTGATVSLPIGVAVTAPPWTWECRFKKAAKPAAINVLVGSGDSGKAVGYIGLTTNGFATFNVYNNTTITGTVNLCDGNAHSLALVATSSGFSGFVDGVQVVTSAVVPAGQGANPALYIGGLTSGGTFPFLSGDIDEVVIWPSAKYTSAGYTVPTSAYAGTEGMTALYHLDSNLTDSSVAQFTVATPTATTVEASIALTGTYGSPVPTGINYAYDGGTSYTAATGFSASGGTWSASTAADAPAAGSHTVTVQEANNTSTTATSGSFTTTASVQIAPNNAALVYSPGNWTTPTASSAATINAGAYFRTLFTGSSCVLNFNVANNSSPLSEVYYRIDGYEAQSPWTRASVATSITVSMPADTSAFPYHLLEVVVKSTSETINRWNSPSNTAVVFAGLTLVSGATVVAPTTLTGSVWFFGDSISEGVRTVNQTATNDTDRNDVMCGWSWHVAKALGREFGIIGFGGSGLTVTGSGNVPVLATSFNLLMAGVARSFSPAPDLIVLNEGTNDKSATAAAVQAAMTTVLASLLAATPATTKIAVLRPFGGFQAAALQAAVVASASGRVSYIDTTGFLNTAYGIDSLSLHPSGPNDMAMIAPQVANALRPLLAQGRSFVFG